MGFVRFLLAAAALPAAAALAFTLVGVFRVAAATGPGASLAAVGGGAALFVAGWLVCPQRPVRAYILGHELTHALCGLLFGARVSNLRVTVRGGSVTLSKSNVFITLAPYFFPFYTALVALAALVTRLARTGPVPYALVWLFAVGFTWCFHVCFTLRTLAQRQPDVQEYGRLFSWVFIWCGNALVVMVGLWAIAGVPCRTLGGVLTEELVRVYASVWCALVYGWGLLPFNR